MLVILAKDTEAPDVLQRCLELEADGIEFGIVKTSKEVIGLIAERMFAGPGGKSLGLVNEVHIKSYPSLASDPDPSVDTLIRLIADSWSTAVAVFKSLTDKEPVLIRKPRPARPERLPEKRPIRVPKRLESAPFRVLASASMPARVSNEQVARLGVWLRGGDTSRS